MAGTLKLEIVTPEAKTYSEDVEMVTLPGVEGEMGVYPQHETLVTELKAGELHITRQGHVDVMAIGEGFAEILGEMVGIAAGPGDHRRDGVACSLAGAKRVLVLVDHYGVGRYGGAGSRGEHGFADHAERCGG